MADSAATRSAGRLNPRARAATATLSRSRWELRPSPSSGTSPASPGSTTPGPAFLVYLFVIAFLTVTAGIYFTPGADSASRPQCNNRIDDDGDGKIDYPTDAGCTGKGDKSEVDPVRPPPPPPPPGYPDASTTGPSGPLAESFGNVTVSTAGAVVENRKINGCVNVTAPDVTIRNSRVLCAGTSAVLSGSTNLLVEDTEVDCLDGAGRTGITWRNYTARRVDVHSCDNVTWAESNVLIVDSYLHDPIPCCGPSNPHTDSIQIPTNGSNIVVRHNRVYGGYLSQQNFGNAAITMGGNVGGIVVDDNVLAGGGYTLRCEHDDLGSGTPALRVTNNRFSTVYVATVGGFGPSAECSDEIQSGNVIHETGQPLHLG
jgi:hypothetical protein